MASMVVPLRLQQKVSKGAVIQATSVRVTTDHS